MAEILYEDSYLIVARKPAGVESQRGKSFAADLESELRTLISRREGQPNPYLGVVHRLDRPVAGVMVYAKTKAAAAALSEQFAGGTTRKQYEALLSGDLKVPEGVFEDLIEQIPGSNLSRIAVTQSAGAKPAKLSYRRAESDASAVFTVESAPDESTFFLCGQKIGSWKGEERGPVSRVLISLETGRRHQIRVQFAARGLPVLGDRRYGTFPDSLSMENRCIALCASRLSFRHPRDKKWLTFDYRRTE